MGPVISMKSKSDPKYALKLFLALKMRECCNVVADDEAVRQLLSSAKVPCYSQLAVQPNEERLGVGSICATNVVIRN